MFYLCCIKSHRVAFFTYEHVIYLPYNKKECFDILFNAFFSICYTGPPSNRVSLFDVFRFIDKLI